MKCCECLTSDVDHPYVICMSCYKRLKRGRGSGAPSCFADAKRSANKTCGGEERSDELESSAVSPGEAVPIAKLKVCIKALRDEAKRIRRKNKTNFDLNGTISRGFAGGLESAATAITKALAQPDSKLVKRASGRRNR